MLSKERHQTATGPDGLEAGYEQALEAMFETLAQGLEPTAFNRVKELLMKGVP